MFVTGDLQGKYADVNAYDGTTKTLSVSDLGATPAEGDTFIII